MNDHKLWLRLILVGLTGAVPLFVVAMLLTQSTYEVPVGFATRERHGIVVERPLEDLLVTLMPYALAARRDATDSSAKGELAAAQRDVQSALDEVTRTYRAQSGNLHPSAREVGATEDHLSALQGLWAAITRPSDLPVGVAERSALIRQMTTALRHFMTEVAERSNLVLDDDPDSYNLMDLSLVAIPEAQEHILQLLVSRPSTLPSSATNVDSRPLLLVTTLLRDFHLARIERNARRTLEEDARFNGTSPSLHQNLPAAVANYTTALRQLIKALEGLNAGLASEADVESSANATWSASAALFDVGAAELDRLLSQRLEALQQRRTTGYAVLVLTLVAAAVGMGLLIRSLLNLRYGELLRVQEQLRAKEAQLRALADNLPGGLVYQLLRERDGTTRFLHVSAGIEAIHGVSVEAAMTNADALYDLLLPEDREALKAAERKSFEQMQTFRAIVRSIRRHDGALRYLEFASAPRQLRDGLVVWDGIQIDVTERLEAEELRRQSQQQFSLIFDNSPMPITLSNRHDGRFVAINDSFLEMSGLSREEVLGRTSLELGVYQDPSRRAELIARLTADGFVHGAEVSFLTKQGTVRDHLLWLNTLTVDAHEYIMATALDVTERNAATKEQRKLEEQLRQTQKLEALGTLAGGIAHDFNNVLGAIISFAELSKLDNERNQPLLENLDQILNASHRATILVRQILSFSRRQKEARENLQLAPIVSEALSLLRATLPTTIAIEKSLDANVGDVSANGTQVHQVIMNLCTNAAHAMAGKGTLELELGQVTLRPSDPKPHVELEARDYVRLTVRDTGHGMDEATLSRVFEPFFTTKRASEGTGLGLSVVHGIIKDYGGVITADSVVGRGTTFTIYLPVAAQSTPRAPIVSSELPRGNGQRVLFVDDEPALGRAATLMLQRLGYQPIVFQDSRAALTAFSAAPRDFGALISDSTMPNLTGPELILEALALHPGLQTILVSGSASAAQSDIAALEGCQVLSKPLSYAALAHALHKALA